MRLSGHTASSVSFGRLSCEPARPGPCGVVSRVGGGVSLWELFKWGVLQRMLFPALSPFPADPANDRLFLGTFNFWMHQVGDGEDSISLSSAGPLSWCRVPHPSCLSYSLSSLSLLGCSWSLLVALHWYEA